MAEFPMTTTTSGAVVISPQGRLNVVAASALREQLRDQVSSGNIRLVVDMSGVDLIDSAGLSALISGLKDARQAGGSLHITQPSKQVRHLLTLTNLNRVFEPCDATDGTVSGPT